MFTPGVSIVGSGNSVWAWGSVDALSHVFPRPGDWMNALCMGARMTVGGEVVGWARLRTLGHAV